METPLENKWTPLKDYFLIGDLHSAALISKKGSIEWLCWPHFDSPSIFAKLIDHEGGCFEVCADEFGSKANYRKHTAILETSYRKGDKHFQGIDFMVPQTNEGEVTHLLVRKFRAKKKMEIKLRFSPKPNYSRGNFKLIKIKSQLLMPLKKELLILHLPKETKVDITGSSAEIKFELSRNQSKSVVLEYSKNNEARYTGEDYENQAEHFWKNWVKKGSYASLCREKLIRSAITLKLMQFHPSGGLVAAPTTSLPETPGGQLNWDYRYVWIRDATLTLYGLQLIGHTEEALRFFQFVEKVARECDECDIHIRPIYNINGSEVPAEKKLEHLSGYKNASPVRIGNAARHQWQLDIYGSVIDAYHYVAKQGILPSAHSKELLLHLVQRIEESWKEKDNGIWEIRGTKHRYTYSRVMAWVGVDRFLGMKEALGLNDEEVKHYKKLRKQIKQWIWEHCFDKKRQMFVQHPSAKRQDATNLLFVLLKFLKRNDPLTKTIIKNTINELRRDKFHIYRYRQTSDKNGKEGAFLLCSSG